MSRVVLASMQAGLQRVHVSLLARGLRLAWRASSAALTWVDCYPHRIDEGYIGSRLCLLRATLSALWVTRPAAPHTPSPLLLSSLELGRHGAPSPIAYVHVYWLGALALGP